MFFGHDDEVDDSPVTDDTEECLECVGEVFGGETTNDDGADEAECDENDTGDADGPWTEVLGVHGEGVVVWDIILYSHQGQ